MACNWDHSIVVSIDFITALVFAIFMAVIMAHSPSPIVIIIVAAILVIVIALIKEVISTNFI